MRGMTLGERTDPDISPQSGSRRIRWVGVAAVIVVAALAVGGIVLSRPRPSQPLVAPTTARSVPTTAPAPVAERLTWAPPRLATPITLAIGPDIHELRLEAGQDYLLVLPRNPLLLAGELVIHGGRNVVLIGGEIVVPSIADAPDPHDRRGLLLKGQTGTVHIEGLRISGAGLSEGIDIDQRDGAVVQLENIAIATVHGSRATNHADVVQVWAGPAQLLIDGLTGTTEYQGLFLLPDQFLSKPPESYDLRRIVITSAQSGPTGGAGYLLWTTDSTPWLSVSDVVLVDPRADLRGMVRPFSAWEQGVRLQSDSVGVRLPRGTPGVSYSSPGYVTQGEM